MISPWSEPSRRVRLFEADPALAKRAPTDLIERLRRYIWVESYPVQPRRPVELPFSCSAALVLSGVLALSHTRLGRRSIELLNTGDCVALGSEDDRHTEDQWIALAGGSVAALDEEAMRALRAAGALGELWQRSERARRRNRELAATLAIPHVATRVYAFLWELAERFGRVGEPGVGVSLAIDQSILGLLVGIDRTTVNRVLARLEREDLVLRSRRSIVVAGERPASAGELKELERQLSGGPVQTRRATDNPQ